MLRAHDLLLGDVIIRITAAVNREAWRESVEIAHSTNIDASSAVICEYWRPTCVNCGTKMIERAGRSGPAFWGCTAFPKCRHTMQMRTGNVPGASLPE